MGKLAALGNHGFHTPHALTMHREVVNLTGQARPNVVLIALASGDDPGYIRSFEQLYHGMLGCKTDVLLLRGVSHPPENAKELISQASLIFFGGGENVSAIAQIKRMGIADWITAAYKRGATVAGEGLGAKILFEGGYAFSMTGIGIETPIVITLQGLGLLHGVLCIAAHNSLVAEEFAASMLGKNNLGFALSADNGLFVEDNSYRTIAFGGQPLFNRITANESLADFTPVFSEKPLPLAYLYEGEPTGIVLRSYEQHRRR